MTARLLTGRLGFDSLVVPVGQEPDLDPLGPEMKANEQTGGRRARSAPTLFTPHNTGLQFRFLHFFFFIIYTLQHTHMTKKCVCTVKDSKTTSKSINKIRPVLMP